jgi:GTP-binding protein HflX
LSSKNRPQRKIGRSRLAGPDGLSLPDETQATGRAIVLVPILSSGRDNDGGLRFSEARLTEAVGLASAIGLEVPSHGVVVVPRPKPATLFGTGKVDELAGLIAAEQAGLAIVDHALTPVQQRNLETAWNVKVLDRTALILEIFGRRARTREGRLQVELAHLDYQKSRLVRSWTHLERQRGGFGFLGGPGETQIETDRRLIQERMHAIRKDLATVRRTRGLQRQGRRRVPYPVVALVGYTNAGKSTLFNALTGAMVPAEDMLFATLDPTIRALELPSGGKAALSDTVGFISDLPTTLIAAFRATLEEVVEADLIIHVRDISEPMREAHRVDVEIVLEELGIDEVRRTLSLVEVWNKIDTLSEDERERLANEAKRHNPPAILASAASGEGLDALRILIESRIRALDETVQLTLGAEQGALMHWLHEHGDVLSRNARADGSVDFVVRLASDRARQLATKHDPA